MMRVDDDDNGGGGGGNGGGDGTIRKGEVWVCVCVWDIVRNMV